MITISIDDNVFDKLVHSGAPDDGQPIFAVKMNATTAGKPGLVIAFRADIDGKIQKVQTVVTINEFLNAARFIEKKCRNDAIGKALPAN